MRAHVTSGLALALLAATADASPRRQGLFGGIGVGGGATMADDDTGPCTLFGVHLGFLFAEAAKVGFAAQGLGDQAWLDGGKRLDAALLASLWLWPSERVSVTIGLGVAGADSGPEEMGQGLVGGGPAASASFGFDLKHWRRSALVLRATAYGGDFDAGTAVHAGLTLGVEWFEITAAAPR